MPKTPPREDEQPEYQPPRRKRQAVTYRTYRHPPMDYTDDDRPEIPKIRRASRAPYQFPESITKDQESIEQQQREVVRIQKQHPDPIMAAKKRATPVYAPPPPARHTQRDLSKRAQRDQHVYFRVSQPVLILCGLLLVVVVVGVVIFNAAHIPQTQNSVVTTGITNNNLPSKLSADSTVVGIKQGETYTLRDLLYGLLLKSGNDAAIAIADGLAGNLPHFVAEMNQRAKQLGLYDTHYMNPHGLSATGHYSSAHDLAILGQYSMSIPIIHQISGTQTYIIPKGGNHPVIPLLNGNQFLFWYPGVDGGKPGFDGVANFVQVISSTRNHHHLIGVTMHTNNWWTDMRNLMNWGFDNFKWVSPHDLDTAQNPIPFDYLWNYFASDKKENTLRTADGGRYYIYTGYSISGPIMAYYDKGGGLQKYGYPISLPTVSSSAVTSQHFEKATIQCDLTTKQCSSQ